MKKILLALLLLGAVHAKEQKIGFAAGCFWGVEKHFEQMDGVVRATSGYAGGDYANPTYKMVLKHRYDEKKGKNYTETVEVIYDDEHISTRKLIEEFWMMHNPTQLDRQGSDYGNNYRSALFYTTDEQKDIALRSKEQYQKLLSKAGYGKIRTQIEKLDKFYPAEQYHQDYLKRNPNGYCPDHSTGVRFELAKKVEQKSITPLGGKEIIVIDADGCPFCEKFKHDVTVEYRGNIPLRTVRKSQLKGFEVDTNLDATPTILFIENGKELASYRGYMSKEEFYKALGAFKLGSDSKAYQIAFAQGTEGRFCKQYDKFKHIKDGVFVDTLSGEILFDTKDRFNSGSGWLSFYRAVDGSTIDKEDNSYGMKRVEIIAKKSGIHLGHRFDDAPGGRQRFCINANVLEFVPRDEVAK